MKTVVSRGLRKTTFSACFVVVSLHFVMGSLPLTTPLVTLLETVATHSSGALATAGEIDGMMVVEGGARSLEAVRRRCGGRV